MAAQSTLDIYDDPTSVTDPTLLRQGAKSYRMLRGLNNDESALNSDFRIQRRGEQFFKRGKVFKVYWPEPISQTLSTAKTSVTGVPPTLRHEIYAKIRWFVVVKPGEGRYCSCLPIQTYNNQGVAKKDVIKGNHAIIHTGRVPPEPNADESPNIAAGERAMLQPIRVVANKKADTMDRMSRVDFAKIYTVEHNVKVYDFGRVHEDHRAFLRHQFNYVWSINDDAEEEESEEDKESEKKKKEKTHKGRKAYQTLRWHEAITPYFYFSFW